MIWAMPSRNAVIGFNEAKMHKKILLTLGVPTIASISRNIGTKIARNSINCGDLTMVERRAVNMIMESPKIMEKMIKNVADVYYKFDKIINPNIVPYIYSRYFESYAEYAGTKNHYK
jgi:uncharacterized protein (DUF4213/DUF364 family)